MEDAVEEHPEKCSAHEKKLFTKGRQNSYQDIIAMLANLVVFFKFISHKNLMQQDSIPCYDTMKGRRDLGDTFVSQFCRKE